MPLVIAEQPRRELRAVSDPAEQPRSELRAESDPAITQGLSAAPPVSFAQRW